MSSHVTRHVTFSAKWPLFEELVAVFSNIILEKRVLDADQLFPSSHVWNHRPFFHRKKIIGWKVIFFNKIRLLFIYIF